MMSMTRQRKDMIERQLRRRGIADPRILAAFAEVPREAFVSAAREDQAYEDRALPIGSGQTISQPYIVARMIAAAMLDPEMRVLEVGAGSGYAAAILSRLVKEVFAIERHADLASEARERVRALGYGNCTIIAGDGMEGLPAEAPFDAILVAAQAQRAPEALLRQLAHGGRLVLPLGDQREQQLTVITRTGEESWEAQAITPVRFVPLLSGMVGPDMTQNTSDGGKEEEQSLSGMIASAAIHLPQPGTSGFAEAFDRFADRRVVMLGESSHGTHEFYAARTAITRHLVEHHGFTIVAVEADWPDAAHYDRFIRGQPPRATESPPFRRFPTWMWRNTVMPDLLVALQRINAPRPEDRQVGFHGLDLYNMAASIEAVLAHLDAHAPDAAAAARERYGCLAHWQEDPASYGHAAMAAGYAACEEPVIQQCRVMLGRALAQDGDAFDAAMNARLVASAEQYYRAMYRGGSDSWNLRDRHMADTLEHLLEARGDGAKAVVWAHNSHIGDARATGMGRTRGELNLGQLARERWGDDAALIGFGTHTGTVTAASDWDGPRETKRVLPSRADSFERHCHDSGAERFLLDFGADAALAERFAETWLERFIGVIYRPETERWSHYVECAPSRQFDAFCWFDTTRALEPLAEAEPEAQGPDDLFPSAL
ncbi:protein-L-isoaspartate(D-aspartate) O-methyltransferase [Erythrobacter sp. NFXS35]|uniref:protein-L-isoaspartate(D-aspartate) O-methyltransferase n=1 Tax=Erythrobacter sp. NFXS35 TaxID=2818436 RepID=UPI0032DF1799